MNDRQLALIPNDLLVPGEDTRPLIDWLWARGWRMSLFEVEQERRRRRLTRRKRY